MALGCRARIAFGLGMILALACPLPRLAAGPLDPEAAALSTVHQDQVRHLALLGLDRWQKSGYRGQGIKIAILDTGFRSYRDYLGKTLPAHVQVRCFREDGNFEGKNSQHGVLCAEVLHALAPEAELLMATWEPDSSERFLEAVRWAKEAGARIISCSVLMPSWSDGEGGGEFHRKLRHILQRDAASPEEALRSASYVGVACACPGALRGLPAFVQGIQMLYVRESMARSDGSQANNILFFACAGNTAQRHWTGPFQAGPGGFHQWLPGQTINHLRPWSRDRVSVELYGPDAIQYEITVRDENGELISQSKPISGNNASIAARFVPQSQPIYQVQVRLKKGAPGNFHLVVLGGSLSTVTSQGSVACPADGSEVIAVGAVTPAGRRLDYSACGIGTQLLKPDFVAPVPFPTTVRSQAFTGTSAASPQAAALAAVLWSRHPQWTAEAVRTLLNQSAHDLGPPGPDCETGYGMIALPPISER